MNSNNVSYKAKTILDDAVSQLDNNEDALESHLPDNITCLDKAALLAILYRVISSI